MTTISRKNKLQFKTRIEDNSKSFLFGNIQQKKKEFIHNMMNYFS